VTPAGGITLREVWWSSAGVALALAPHVTRLPPLLPLIFLALLAWRLLGAHGKARLPHREQRLLWLATQIGAVALFVAIYARYQGELGRDAGVALLSGLIGLKVLEMKESRDFYVVCFLAYFLVVTNFFYSQSIPTACYLLGVTVLVTTALVRFNSPPALGDRVCLRLAARMVAESVPVMVLCFVLFPRLPGPLWGLPGADDSAVTGLSDQMEIGRIAHLGTSDEIAFRVAFEGQRPRARDLYWRGPVLWDTDGRRWQAGSVARQGAAATVVPRGPRYRYEILLEPHGERWLLGLDAVTAGDATVRSSRALELSARQPVKRRARYTLESATAYTLPDITPAERRAALALPADAHPRTRKLATSWRAAAANDQAVIESALARFAAAPYAYTLTPPLLDEDPIDQFLFDTRQGFCEHYAAAFVVLMRASGIPARVVTGYQGGEYNGVSDYMLVRQRDAHAWAEVHLPGEGWIRVDPTAAVAPERVSLGIGDFNRGQSALPLLDGDSPAYEVWRSARQLWDAANYEWSQWVLGYTPQRQRDLLSRLGLDSMNAAELAFALTGALALMMGGLAALLLRRQSPPGTPAMRAYAQFCARLARVGLAREPHEGPLEFAERVAAARADLALAAREISRLYALLRYADAPAGLDILRQRVQRFRPGPPPA
jgi:transglutaminase-like putative cysteine protease